MVVQARPTHYAKALYDYTRQTDEELSFSEDSNLLVYDTVDPDWTLVGLNGEYGFAPANYIEILGEVDQRSPASPISPQLPPRTTEAVLSSSPDIKATPPSGPAAALAGIMRKQTTDLGSNAKSSVDSPPLHAPHKRPQYTPEDSDEEPASPPPPSLPQRSPSLPFPPPNTEDASKEPESPEVTSSSSYRHVASHDYDGPKSPPGGYHLYNINEMVSALGKKKKLPTTLGLNLRTGKIMIAPERSKDGPQQEWTAEKLRHYSIEGKHVFVELVRPSKSFDFHAGAKDTAQEIVSGLGEIAGAVRAAGLREVLEASAGTGGGLKKGRVLYDFTAQGEDEVTVAVNDEVIIIDDTKSDDWWMVRKLSNGNEGVVPSSYIEETGMMSSPTDPALQAARSIVEQNRLEEERLAKEAMKAPKARENDARGLEVGPGVKLPKRGSSLVGANDGNQSSSQRSKKESKSHGRSGSSSKSSKRCAPALYMCTLMRHLEPDPSKIRTWTDRSGSFKVEAQFIGLKDGKIHLHKLNGVKIAVVVAKMAVEDLEYVESVTGVSLDDEKPLSDIRRRSLQAANKDDRKQSQASPTSKAESSVEKPKLPEAKEPGYDWFDFFLKAGVSPYLCERYALSFYTDSMDEAILPDITPSVLRTLGLKEGDVLRVTKYLDTKYGRGGPKSKLRNVSFGGEELISPEEDGNNVSVGAGGGLFSGPGGALRNNTRKGRPAPPVQTEDVVDAEAFRQKKPTKSVERDGSENPASASVGTAEKTRSGGFDDDAWDVKPSKRPNLPQSPTAPSASAKATPPQPALTGAFAELSLLSEPLKPTVVHSSGGQESQHTQSQPALTSPPQQPISGPGQLSFSQIGQQSTKLESQQQIPPQFLPPLSSNNQQTFQAQQTPQQNLAQRQRPQAPPIVQSAPFMLPPPPRPLSAPQNASQNNNFGPSPLQPQLTGVQNQLNLQNRIVPSGQSLNDLEQARLRQIQSLHQNYPQAAGFIQPNPGYGQYGPSVHQTGLGQQQFPVPQQHPGFQNSPQFLGGPQTGSPFADPIPLQQMGSFQPLMPQMTGFLSQTQAPTQTQPPGPINTYLPSTLQLQATGANGVGPGMNGLANQAAFGHAQPPPPPPIPSALQPPLAPLQPQKTGPAPPIRFGVGEAKKLAPQVTGRRANLSQASKCNQK